ncbi:HET-domain-containing protein [Rhizodiscina lignyota]|uniref:HET-domain-containing protein n=1 Tax=Rhizodiscina lignyota TaxID=1504668 RepID=A0A9P4M1K7_9PEZI|nr:HET-domain-containing protein [Rhizodiscina lignyota]
MRLLQTRALKLFQFYGDFIPSYAILSHTWGLEEVTFQDMQNGKAASKTGYEKIQSCCDQAVEDGFQYCWIDTCCIDKTSSSELSEAINSMFSWYAKAERCYVHLSDLPPELSESDVLEELPDCRWFTRGWNLQELLAPKEITSIHEDALTGDYPNIEGYSVAQRLSWASERQTTRIKDMAYSLMGIFKVHMPLLYGEGWRAFERLQEEIIKISDDDSIFTWRDARSDADDTWTSLLPPAPSYFGGCSSIAAPAANYMIPRDDSGDDVAHAGGATRWRCHDAT